MRIDYRDPRHADLPHVMKFSGGRASGMLLSTLLESRQLNADRGDVVFNNTAAASARNGDPNREDTRMSVSLMHIEYQPTNISPPTAAFHQIADWLNERFRNDEQLEAAERADPMSVNVLANIVTDDEPPMTMDRKAVLKFQAIVHRNTRGESTDARTREISNAAREIADRIAELSEHQDPLHLALV